ncbi:MAG: CAP domain-containing protein [Lentimicrobiaceae bacterium]|nr:CAP domain-containing protein [Lentimicrobiaceae bacterium]
MNTFSTFFRNGLGVLLLVACINGKAQQSSSYEDFDANSLINGNEKYAWNFNPIEYDHEILASCIIDVVNLARQKYNFADPLVLSEVLETAARFQSEGMAKKEERTQENTIKALRTPELRSMKAGGTKRVAELVTRVKATRGSGGSGEYSYLDVAADAVLSLLKNKKTENTLLSKSFTYVGVGCKPDKNNRNCYVSIVFGNDLSFNKEDIAYKNTVYTRKVYGLKPYTEKTCRKCQVRNIELMQQNIVVKGYDIFFSHPNTKVLKRLIGKKGDAIAVDIVQHSQYECGKPNDVDFNFYNRGVMLKPVTFDKMMKKNEIKNKKDKSMYAYIGTAPNTVSTPFDVNVVIIKNGTVCRTAVRTHVETPAIDYQAKTSLVPDLDGIQTTINYIPQAEKTQLEMNIPFDKNKYTYEPADIQPFIDALNTPRFIIDTIFITAFTSLEGSDRSNADLQKKRSESIVAAVKKLQDKQNIPYFIDYNDGWDLFVKDVAGTQYKDLASRSKEDARAAINQGKTQKDLEPMLAKHRFANIKISATYDISNDEYEQDFVTSKFNAVLAQGDLPLAFAIQKYMIKKVEEGKYKKNFIENLVIPVEMRMIPFLTNKYYMLSFFSGGLSAANIDKVVDLEKMDSKNPICEFNALACTITDGEITAASQIAGTQGKIDRMYNGAVGKKYPNKVDALNIAFQYQILDYINSSENPDETLMENTYEKIKEIAMPTISNWKNAYEVASSFINFGDYEFARKALDPFINDPTVSEDFIFTYMSLYSLDENNYTSKKFETACKLASEKNKSRFCSEIKTYSILIQENLSVKGIICKECK